MQSIDVEGSCINGTGLDRRAVDDELLCQLRGSDFVQYGFQKNFQRSYGGMAQTAVRVFVGVAGLQLCSSDVKVLRVCLY